jgi:hypothetical protein
VSAGGSRPSPDEEPAAGVRRFRAGDVLRLSCPATPARVTAVRRGTVALKWPWWRHDPDCDWIEWNGDVALAAGEDASVWERSLFRTEPPLEELTVGAACTVGIPPTVVHVVRVTHFETPPETGRLPRPRGCVTVMPAGESFDPDFDEEFVQQGEGFDPEDDIPLTFEPLFRPYAFVEEGDEVVDADSRAWRFDGPWDWAPYDGAGPPEPRWPLTLLTRSGATGPGRPPGPDPVARATASGSHEEEVRHWRSLTDAEPPVREHHEEE